MADPKRIIDGSVVWSKDTGICRTRHIADDVYEIVRASGKAVWSEQSLRDPARFRLIEYPATPNLQKMREARDTLGTQHIGAFLEWVFQEKDWHICEFNQHFGIFKPIDVEGGFQAIIALYAEVDIQACDSEKEAVLEFQRALNDLHDEIPEAER